MARARSDLPRMQKQSPTRAPLERAVALPQVIEKPTQSRKPPMMRQYDLIERVRRYNPKTNEALLNRAYVYAMKAHGEQRRASGDPYFSHPIEVAAILTDLKLDDATIAAALLHDTIEDTATTRAEIDSLFGPDMRTLDYMPVETRRRAAEETLEIYAPLAGRMGMHAMREELDDLAFRELYPCLLYTSPSPRDRTRSRMPSSA